MNTLDTATLADLFARPGMDTRQWLSYGIVQADSGDQHAVSFNDDTGTPHPQGALVDVKLMPSGIPVSCRVLSKAAGAGEGEWDPIGPGDEVLVAIPEGDERAGCVILGKLSNAFDVFPQAVAGQDVTQNNITFKRTKTPFIFETGASYMIRSALSGASFSIDPTGNIMLSDGSGNMLGLNADVLTLQESTGAALFQIIPGKTPQAVMQGGASAMQMSDSGVNMLTTGTVSMGSGGNSPVFHLATVEGIINILTKLGTTFVPGWTPLQLQGAIAAAAGLSLDPLTVAAISGAFAAQPNGDTTGTSPGIGCSQFFVG